MPTVLEPPLVLVVEDEKKARDLRVELFEGSGFAAIGVPSKKDAERELRACPSIDLLVTDVNLNAANPGDKSGLELAKEIKVTRPELPVIGYSGRLSEADLPGDDILIFKAVHLKGKDPMNVMRTHLGEWRDLAIKHRRARTMRATSELERLQRRYSIDEYDFNLLREFIPAISETASLNATRPAEEVLSAAGFRLKIIEPRDIGNAVVTEGVQIKSAVPIWLRLAENHVVAEVYRFPELYAAGASDDEAIRQVLLLMEGYFQDLRSASDETLSPALVSLKNYLLHLFEK